MSGALAWLKKGFDGHLGISTVLVVVFVILIVTVTCFRPLADRWNDGREQIQAEKMKLARHIRLVSQKPDLLAELAEYEEKFKLKHSPDEEVTVFLKELEDLLTQASLRVTNIRPVPNPDKSVRDDLEVIMIEFTVEGEMEQWVNFLYSVAQPDDLLDIRGMSILRRRTGEGNLAITAEVTKTLFVK